MSRLLAVVVFAWCLSAFADKPRISILNFKGSKGSAVKAQLTKSLCRAFTCVKPGKSESVPVDAVVTGEVTKRDVSLTVYFDENAQPVVRTLSLVSGKALARTSLKNAADAVKEAVASSGG